MNINKFRIVLSTAYEIVSNTLTPINYGKSIKQVQGFLKSHDIHLTERQVRIFLIDYQLAGGIQ